jgi:hydrogenase nickel incorporation protein HypB
VKKIDVKKPILSANDRQAEANAARFAEKNLVAVNVMASPGAGKTSLIVRLLEMLPKRLAAGVIEGDIASSIDADKIALLGFPVTQINTGGGCHLDAAMISRSLDALDPKGPGYVFIENIGNLVCPAEFRLGEKLRLVVASVPEGDDKPVKYPAMYAQADAVILNKADLLATEPFRMDFFVEGLQAVNARAPLFEVSCRTGSGLSDVLQWLMAAGGVC